MEASKTDADEDLRSGLLAGDEPAINRALVQVHERYAKRVCGFVRSRFPGISSHDLQDVWQSTLTELLEAARNRTLRLASTLAGWLCTAARRNATDRFRRGRTADAYLDAVAAALRDTTTGALWHGFDVADRREVLGLIRDAVCRLPAKQRVVMEAFVDGYPETRTMDVLRREVSSRLGQAQTLPAVRRAFQEARGKVKGILERRGLRGDL